VSRIPGFLRLPSVLALVVGVVTVGSRQMASAVPSADPSRVVFVVTSGGTSQLWTMTPNGSDPHVLAGQPAGSNTDPAAAPDGTRIAFASTHSGNSDIWSIDLTGSGLTQLTADPGSDSAPAWSGDGNTIAFQSDRTGNMDVWLMDPDGAAQTQLTHNSASDSQPAWFPRARRLAFQSNRSGNADIWTVNADGSKLTRLTTSTAPDTQPSVSPSGKAIAFASHRLSNTDVYTTSVRRGGVVRVTSNPAIDNQPAFSTDGRYLAFTSTRSGTAQIWRVPRPSGSPVRLTTGSDPAAGADWTPYPYPSPASSDRFEGIDPTTTPYAIAQSPDGSEVFVAGGETADGSTLDGFLVAYDQSGTRLWSQEFPNDHPRRAAAYDVAVSPDGASVYVTGFVDKELSIFRFNAHTGAFQNAHDLLFETHTIGFAITVSPDSSTIYVAATAYDFDGSPAEAVTIALNLGLFPQWTSILPRGDPAQSTLRTSPSGDTLYWTGIRYQGSARQFRTHDYVTVAYRTSDGSLKWSAEYNGPGNSEDNAWMLQLSPDGSKAYVSGWSVGSGTHADQATLAYDTSTGAQLWLNRYDSPNHGWDWAYAMAVSPDGSTLYTGGGRSRTVGTALTYDYLTTSIDTGDGTLSWARFYDGPGDFTGYAAADFAPSVNVAPDGGTVYLSGRSYRTGTSFDMTSVAYDADGNRVWLARYDGPQHAGDYGRISVLSPDGSTLFIAGQSGSGRPDAATVTWDVSGVAV
jgi:WD40 repeat protein